MKKGTGTKVALIGGGLLLLTGAMFLVKKGAAANKLQLDFSDFKVSLSGVGDYYVSNKGKLSLGRLPTQIIATVEFNAINPTNETLVFSTPYVTLTTDTKKDAKIIGHSTPDAAQITIPAKGNRLIPITVNIPLLSMLAIFPDYIQYAWGRANGETSTRKLIAKYDYTAYNINLSDQSVVNL